MSVKTPTIQLSELLGALSVALDLTEGQPAGHCLRTCWIGTNIGIHLGLEGESLGNLYYTLLLKDLGCTSNAARICELFLDDDISFKSDYMSVDQNSLPQSVGFLLSHSGLGKDIGSRFRTLVNVLRNLDSFSRDMVGTRCERGADIARKMRFNEEVAEGIRHLDEQWNGKGKPLGLKGHEIPRNSQIALLSQVVDALAMANGPEEAVREVNRRSGTWFDPELLAAFNAVAAEPGFWSTWGDASLERNLFSLEPAQATTEVDEDYLDDIAHAFAQIIDSKSPFTSGHSERVTLFADMIAENLGMSPQRRRWLRRAALLHDIGKLGVSNAILDKAGKLDPDEWEAIKRHPAYTQDVLSRVAAFSDLAPIAAAHHERLDGKGYPLGLDSTAIAFETRIITVADIYDALTAERPYRPAMSSAKALGIMDEMVGTQIDETCYNALKQALACLEARALAPDPDALPSGEDVVSVTLPPQLRHDEMTGLQNRITFRTRTEEALAACAARGESVSVLFLHLSGAGAANDTLLDMAAARVRSTIREEDFSMRIENAKFAILQSPVAQVGESAWLGARLVAALSTPYTIDGRDLRVSASVGIALSPGNGVDADALLESADTALHAAKREGLNHYRFAETAKEPVRKAS